LKPPKSIPVPEVSFGLKARGVAFAVKPKPKIAASVSDPVVDNNPTISQRLELKEKSDSPTGFSLLGAYGSSDDSE